MCGVIALVVSIPFLYDLLPGVRARRAASREAREHLLSRGARFTGGNSDAIDGGIHLQDTNVTDDDLGQLALFSGWVDTLDVSGTQITDRALANIADLKYLSYLDLSRTAITDRGLALLPPTDSRWALVELNLSQTQITNAGLRHLQGRRMASQTRSVRDRRDRRRPRLFAGDEESARIESRWDQRDRLGAYVPGNRRH